MESPRSSPWSTTYPKIHGCLHPIYPILSSTYSRPFIRVFIYVPPPRSLRHSSLFPISSLTRRFVFLFSWIILYSCKHLISTSSRPFPLFILELFSIEQNFSVVIFRFEFWVFLFRRVPFWRTLLSRFFLRWHVWPVGWRFHLCASTFTLDIITTIVDRHTFPTINLHLTDNLDFDFHLSLDLSPPTDTREKPPEART